MADPTVPIDPESIEFNDPDNIPAMPELTESQQKMFKTYYVLSANPTFDKFDVSNDISKQLADIWHDR